MLCIHSIHGTDGLDFAIIVRLINPNPKLIPMQKKKRRKLREVLRLRKPKKSTIVAVVGFILVIVILSLTLGKNIVAQKQPTLTSFTIVNFAGYLFFLLIPVEALIPYYMAMGYNWLMLGIIALVTALLAQVIDYAIGYALPSHIIENMIGTKKHDKFKRLVRRYGKHVIFFFNLFPLSSPIVLLIAGLERYDFRTTIKYSFSGLVLKYASWIAITYWIL